MSIKIIDAALEVPCSSTDKLVLLVLANYANDEGINCWPSTATLQRQTGLSERAIRSSFRRLEQRGVLEVIHNMGRSNNFVIHTPARGAGTPARGAGVPRHVVPPIRHLYPSRNLKKEKPLETVIERQRSLQIMQVIHKRRAEGGKNG